MQEINVAYTAIQLIISERDLLAEDNQDSTLSDEESDNSDCEAEFDTTTNNNKHNKQSKKKYNNKRENMKRKRSLNARWRKK